LTAVEFICDSLARLRDFPPAARRAAVYQLERVQRGVEPDDSKPIQAVGQCVRELRKDWQMARQTFASIWDARENTVAEAANMRARSELMIAVRTKVEAWKLSQTAAAKRLGLTQPRLNDLMRGRIDKFSLDALINLAGAAGLAVRLQIKDAA
jgi:predicted XRE-type DNA-binding protein